MPKPFFDYSHKRKLQEIIRVNHAGEFGAKRIYEGQIKYTKSAEDKKLLNHMLEQEQVHLDYFSSQIRGGVRPTIFMPIWNLGGYLMGALSAKVNLKTAMLVTKSVEDVIENHYEEQINYLEQTDPQNPLLEKIKSFRDDEINHKNIAIEYESFPSVFAKIFENGIKVICKSAIFLSKKL